MAANLSIVVLKPLNLPDGNGIKIWGKISWQ